MEITTPTAATGTVATAHPSSEPLSDSRRERYAQARLSGATQARAFAIAGYSSLSAHDNSWRLEQEIEVRDRIAWLQREAARGVIIDKQVVLADIWAMYMTDLSDIRRIEVSPCMLCWSEAAIAAATASNLLCGPGVTVLPPDFMKPQPDCRACGGAGHMRTVLKPIDEWTPTARRMLSEATTDKDGVTKVKFIGREWMADYLAKTGGWNVDKHVNLNANLDLPPLKDMTDADKDRVIAALG